MDKKNSAFYPAIIRPPGNALLHLFVVNINLGTSNVLMNLLFFYTQVVSLDTMPSMQELKNKINFLITGFPNFVHSGNGECTYRTSYASSGSSIGLVSVAELRPSFSLVWPPSFHDLP